MGLKGQKKGPSSLGGAAALLERYKYVGLVVLLGAVLLLWPETAGTASPGEGGTMGATESAFDLEAMERKLADTLSGIEGAGEVRVVLSVKNSAKSVLAEDKRAVVEETGRETTLETVVISTGSGSQSPVLVEQVYPEFRGALVVCGGGDEVNVRLKLVEAVSALTGLGTDKICVCKGK